MQVEAIGLEGKNIIVPLQTIEGKKIPTIEWSQEGTIDHAYNRIEPIL